MIRCSSSSMCVGNSGFSKAMLLMNLDLNKIMAMKIPELIFNVKKPLNILAISVVAFLGIVGVGFLTLLNTDLAMISFVLGFIIIGVAFGATRNIIVPVGLFIIFNSVILLQRELAIGMAELGIWFAQGLLIVAISVILALIFNKGLTETRFIIFGALSGLAIGLISLHTAFGI